MVDDLEARLVAALRDLEAARGDADAARDESADLRARLPRGHRRREGPRAPARPPVDDRRPCPTPPDLAQERLADLDDRRAAEAELAASSSSGSNATVAS